MSSSQILFSGQIARIGRAMFASKTGFEEIAGVVRGGTGRFARKAVHHEGSLLAGVAIGAYRPLPFRGRAATFSGMSGRSRAAPAALLCRSPPAAGLFV